MLPSSVRRTLRVVLLREAASPKNTSGSSSSSIFSHSDKTATKRSRSPSAADLAIALTKPNRNNDREGSYNDHKHNKRDGKGRNSDEVMTTLNNGSVAKRAATQLEHDMRKLFAARHDLRVMRMFREALNKGLKPTFESYRIAIRCAGKLRLPDVILWVLDLAIRQGAFLPGHTHLYEVALSEVARVPRVDIIKKVESLMEEFHVRPSISYLVRLSQAYARTTPVDFTKLDQIQSQVTALSPEPNLSLMGSYLVAFDRSNLLENAMDIVKNIMSLNVDIPLDVACGMVRVMAACQSYENVAQFLGTLPDRLLVGFQSTPYTRMMTAGSSAQLPVIIYEFAIEGFLTARKVQSALHLISAIPKDISNILLVYKRMFLHFAEQGDLEKMEEWYRRMRFHTSYSGAGMRIASGVAATLATKLVQAGRADYLFQNLGPGRSLFTTTPTVLGAVVDALDTNSIPKYCIAKLERAVVNYNHSMQPSYVLMREYARKGRYRDVNRLFYRLLKRIKEPSDLMYSFVIEASLLANQPDRALEAFEQMKEAGMHPNLTACRLLSKHYAFNGPDIVRLTELWDSAAKSIDGVDNDPGLAGFTLIGLVHAENFNGAIDLYTSKRLTVLWPEEALNALVLCYLRADQDEKAAKLFEELHGSQPRVHPISYIGMLHSCVAKWQREEFSKLAKDFSSSIQGQLPASHFTPSKFVAGLVALIKDKQFIDSSSTVYISLSKWETENASKQLTHDELRSFSALVSAIS